MIKSKAIVYGDDINTDLIIAGKYTKTLNVQDLVDHCMEDLDPGFHEKVAGGAAVIVAGKYFGCGSSREQAPVALLNSGVKCIAAKSFSRIFYRSAINVGLPIVECDTSGIGEGDVIEYELGSGELRDLTTGAVLPVTPLPPLMVSILNAGGTVEYIKRHGGFDGIGQEG